MWLWVRGGVDSYEITLRATGGVIGSVDVFDYEGFDGGRGYTPECPGGVVSPLYPEGGIPLVDDDGEPLLDYLFRLLRLTNGRHQMSVGDATSGNLNTVSLTVPQSQEGYIVVIDARAGTGLVGGTVEYSISTDTGQFNVDEFAQDQLPVEVTHWVNNIDDCLDEGLVPLPPLPDELGDVPDPGVPEVPEVPEVPTSGSPISGQDLLDAALPAPGA